MAVLFAVVGITGYADNSKITQRTNKSITFVVDENLTPVDYPYRVSLPTAFFQVSREIDR